jgi:hypothetical protein
MKCRRARPDEAESILRFWKDSGASMSTTDEAGYIRRVTENPAVVFLLALLDGKIVGSLLSMAGAATCIGWSWLLNIGATASHESSCVASNRCSWSGESGERRC